MPAVLARSLLVLALLQPALARGAVITFGGIGGETGDLFNLPYVESGFLVRQTTGRWLKAQVQVGSSVPGNPQPAIYGDTFTASLEVTELANGLFTFTGFDLSSNEFDFVATDSPVRYTVIGSLGGQTIFSQTGEVGTAAFVGIISPSAAQIDKLRFEMVRLDSQAYVLDNIRLNEPLAQAPVPEPASVLCWGAIGLIGLAAYRRRRTAS